MHIYDKCAISVKPSFLRNFKKKNLFNRMNNSALIENNISIPVCGTLKIL